MGSWKNRLNLAINRARTVAVVMCNRELIKLDALRVEHRRIGNVAACLHAEAKGE